MKTLFAALCLLLFISCDSSEDDKIKELELKLNQQQNQINESEKERLQAELDQKNKELEMLDKNKPKSAPRSNFFARGQGLFPEGSERRLTHYDLVDLSSRDLKIMRNEIFARHGYIFKTRDMIDYFSGQSWYQPVNSDVGSLLSGIEKENVNLIQAYE